MNPAALLPPSPNLAVALFVKQHKPGGLDEGQAATRAACLREGHLGLITVSSLAVLAFLEANPLHKPVGKLTNPATLESGTP
jgi:hypothetical protein